jgi:hypothetical protein
VPVWLPWVQRPSRKTSPNRPAINLAPPIAPTEIVLKRIETVTSPVSNAIEANVLLNRPAGMATSVQDSKARTGNDHRINLGAQIAPRERTVLVPRLVNPIAGRTVAGPPFPALNPRPVINRTTPGQTILRIGHEVEIAVRTCPTNVRFPKASLADPECKVPDSNPDASSPVAATPGLSSIPEADSAAPLFLARRLLVRGSAEALAPDLVVPRSDKAGNFADPVCLAHVPFRMVDAVIRECLAPASAKAAPCAIHPSAGKAVQGSVRKTIISVRANQDQIFVRALEEVVRRCKIQNSKRSSNCSIKTGMA